MNPARLYTWPDVLRGMVIYAAGDTAAALILGQFKLTRMLGMMLVGGLVYALEIPHYFRWIDRRVPESRSAGATLHRTAYAMLYFNPLWIARHLLFIHLSAAEWGAIRWTLVATGSWSWLVNIPLSLAGNFAIQNALPARWRFPGSALFSALMAVYYALSAVWFRPGGGGP